MRRALLLVLSSIVVVPVASAQLILGTEDAPELPDVSGDVGTLPAYQGPTDFLDLTAAWFQYNEKTDQVFVTIRVAGAADIRSAPPGYSVGCALSGNVTGAGERQGTLFVTWVQPENHTYIDQWVTYDKGTSSQSVTATDLPHAFTTDLGSPGYFRFAIARSALVKLGDQFEEPYGRCLGFIDQSRTSETREFGGFVAASDEATSRAAYSFVDLRQSRTANGDKMDPVEKFERENATRSPSDSSTTLSHSRMPGFSVIVVFLAASGGMVLRRRRE